MKTGSKTADLKDCGVEQLEDSFELAAQRVNTFDMPSSVSSKAEHTTAQVINITFDKSNGSSM